MGGKHRFVSVGCWGVFGREVEVFFLGMIGRFGSRSAGVGLV